MAESEAAAAHTFTSCDSKIAVPHGPNAAHIHHQIGRWCAYNKAEGIDAVKIDGAYWMYMSHERIKAALPWMDISTIRRNIKRLIRAGLLETRLRKGTKTERISSPSALLYRALKYVDAGVFKMNSRGVQNEQVRGGQNEHVEYVNLEPEKKKQVRRVYAIASKGENRTKTTTTREHSPRSTRSADGFETFGQVIEKAPKKKTQPRPLSPKPLSDAQIRINQEAQAAQAAEDKERLIPGLRDLATTLLIRRDVPQPIRETIEAALQEEYNPFYDGWDHDVLYAWVKQLQAMQTKPNPQPQPETVAEAAG